MPAGERSTSSHLDEIKTIQRRILAKYSDPIAADFAAAFERTHSRSDAARPPPPPYSIRKGLRAWHITINGDPLELKHERGISYVTYLFLNPPVHPIHGLDVVAHIPELYRKQLGITRLEDPSTGKALALESHARIQERSLAIDNAEAIRTHLRAQKRLEATLESENASPAEKEEALKELEESIEFTTSHARQTQDQAQNAADAVRLAIRRLQHHLAGAVETDGGPHLGLRALADHIEKYILIPSARRSASGSPGCFTYEPPPGVRWVHVGAGATSQEPGARSHEPGAGSREPVADSG